MEGRPERIVDYFAVVGLGDDVTLFQQFPSDEVDLPGHVTAEPVTDITAVYRRHESCPKGYTLLESTPGGHSASLSSSSIFSGPLHLCFRQGRDKAPIVEISIFQANQNHSPPVGHETLAFSLGGRPADLHRATPTFLTFKRGVLYGHNNAITGLCVIAPSKGEEPPAGYKMLHTEMSKSLVGPSLFLCYRSNIVHPQSTAYTPELLARYPESDFPEFPLPSSMPLFCLPFGVSVEHWERHAPFPLPTFSTFSLTNASGQCMYGAVVVFYEPLTEHKSLSAMKTNLGVEPEEPLHLNKCVCLLSHWPFFAAFKSFLSALYRLSVSRNISIPLERYVGNLMLEVPFPSLERPRVQMQIGSENIVFSLPVRTPLPLSVPTHWSLLSSLSPPHCTTLLSLLLLEQKLVLHSARPALLTSVGEALRSVLFPFAWQCTYIPLCPLAFSSYLQAPVPFIIGIDSQFFDVFEKPTDVSVVDLDADLVTLCREAKTLLETCQLPAKAAKVLKQALTQLTVKVAGLDSGSDFAVEVAPIEFRDTYKTDLETVDVEIREAFLRFHATIIGNYRKCLRPLLAPPSERSRDASVLFDQKAFLKLCPSSDVPFFQYLFDTQIFTAFIEQRSFAHSESAALAFFDECTEKVKLKPAAKLLNVDQDLSRRSDLPTVVAQPPDSAGLPKGKTYNYPVFPRQLDPALFHSASCPLPPHSSSSSSSSSQQQQQQRRRRQLTTGASPLIGRRTHTEKSKDKEVLEKALQGDGTLWSRCLLSHVCSLWYVLLPAQLATHWNKLGLIAQALELLHDMQHRQALPNDEVCYRVLMDRCVALGRPALAVRVYHEMVRAGLQPNAVTYGFYNKAVLEGHWPSTKRNWTVLRNVIRACSYLLAAKRRRGEGVRGEGRRGEEGRGETVEEMDVFGGEGEFSLGPRKTSVSSRKSISALDVGLEEAGQAGSTLSRSRKSHRAPVYKLSSEMGGDYVVRGDASYVADKSPRWGNSPEGKPMTRGVWSTIVGNHGNSRSKRTNRHLVSEEEPAATPSLRVEMTSCTVCPSCGRLLYDEEIMSNWSADEGDLKTSCRYCYTRLVASLTISITQSLPCPEGCPEHSPSTSSTTTILEVAEETDHAHSRRATPTRSMTWGERDPRKLVHSNTVEEEEEGDPNFTGNGPPDLEQTENSLRMTTEVSSASLPPDLTHGVGFKSDSLFLAPPKTDPIPRRSGSHSSLRSSTDSPTPTRSRTESPIPDITIDPSPSSNSIPSNPIHAFPKTDSREEPDFGYIAKLRARGHKRSSSAPVHLPPPPPPSPTSHTVTGEGSDPGVDRTLKPLHVEPRPPLVVPYLSPVVLRKEAESVISRDGTGCLETEELVRDRPIIYWNLVWYFTRLQLPTHLPLLSLWAFTRAHPQLSKHSVRLSLALLWDSRVTGVRDPLYLIWLGKSPAPAPLPGPAPPLLRRDSESQLQSLVARIQCGDLVPVLTSLLKDRDEKGVGQGAGLTHRSLYRETLFLQCILLDNDIDVFDRDYSQHLQKLPRELSARLRPEDHAPPPRMRHCRKDLGRLQLV